VSDKDENENDNHPFGCGFAALRLIGLEHRYGAGAENLVKALLASGYITNVPITVTNFAPMATDDRTRLDDIASRFQ